MLPPTAHLWSALHLSKPPTHRPAPHVSSPHRSYPRRHADPRRHPAPLCVPPAIAAAPLLLHLAQDLTVHPSGFTRYLFPWHAVSEIGLIRRYGWGIGRTFFLRTPRPRDVVLQASTPHQLTFGANPAPHPPAPKIACYIDPHLPILFLPLRSPIPASADIQNARLRPRHEEPALRPVVSSLPWQRGMAICAVAAASPHLQYSTSMVCRESYIHVNSTDST
ncbi:hypothetical protein DFH09DRAFT_1321433 [Mycena vulgaris]|nr:hypothetical protein DFH09DRAFT_1321433 [Mycena vulgaris]